MLSEKTFKKIAVAICFVLDVTCDVMVMAMAVLVIYYVACLFKLFSATHLIYQLFIVNCIFLQSNV